MKILHPHWKYRNLTFVFIGIIATIAFSKTELFNTFLANVGTWGYVGAFFAGMLFVSTFTVTAGILVLFNLAKILNPFELALVAGAGGVIGDFLIFKLVKDDLVNELKEIYDKDFDGKHLSRVLHTKYFSWMMPVIGALLVASPVPNEIGISLMGISKISAKKFILLSFVLNSVAVFGTISLGKL